MKLKYLYIFIPLSIFLNFTNLNLLCFFVAIIATIPLSLKISSITEKMSHIFGDKVSGLISASTSNLPELFICFFALKAGMINLVKAGIIGSIIGNLLLVQGLCVLLGGIKYTKQSFNKNLAKTNIGLLFLALTGITITFIFSMLSKLTEKLNYLSLDISVILLIFYLLGLIFSLCTHKNLFTANEDSLNNYIPQLKKNKVFFKYILLFIIICSFVALESEIIISKIGFVTDFFYISQDFLGIILVPLIGNIPEYTTALMMSLKNKVNLYIEITVGSGIQMALFVAPLLTIISYLFLTPLNLVYNLYHITALFIAICLSFFVFQDGKTYWLEGAILIATYIIISLGYYFM